MSPGFEKQMVRACLLALARRAGGSLVVPYIEIDHDFDERDLVIVCDGDTRSVRVSIAGRDE